MTTGGLLYPETVIFWGAGATAALDMPTTAEIGKALSKLADGPSNEDVSLETVKKVFEVDDDTAEDICDLLRILGSSPTKKNAPTDEINPKQPDPNKPNDKPPQVARQFIKRQFEDRGIKKKNWEVQVRYLRRLYPWTTLKRIIQACPKGQDGVIQLLDLFNLIDMHIRENRGFETPQPNQFKDLFVRPEDLPGARNALIMIINLRIYIGYHRLISKKESDKKSDFDRYYDFAHYLARLMQKEGQQLAQKFPVDSRRFYLFSYAIVCMNWDPLLLWLIFCAHKDVNENQPKPVGKDGQPLKLLNDLGHFAGIRRIDFDKLKDSDKPKDHNKLKIMYPCSVPVVQRINDEEYKSGRRYRIGKFYFPHGCTAWRQCPRCAKLMIHLGDSWETKQSESLLPPQLLLKWSERCQTRSDIEKEARLGGRADVQECSYCGTETELRHTPMVMQTLLKDNYPTFLSEIQGDMQACLQKAKHIILFGYSLPADDIIYRALLAARIEKSDSHRPWCTVVIGKIKKADPQEKRELLEGDSLQAYLKKTEKEPDRTFSETIKTARAIFGKDRVRGFPYGIPEVFLDEEGVSEVRIRELLNPNDERLVPVDRS